MIGAGKRAKLLGPQAAVVKDPSAIPNTHKTGSNLLELQFRGTSALFWATSDPRYTCGTHTAIL